MVCVTCKGEFGPPSILIRKDSPPLCDKCFQTACVHKFRSSFGKANIVRNRESVALAFSGGASSLAMLHLTMMSHAKIQSRKLRFRPTLICLYDVGEPYPDKQESYMKESGFQYQIVRTDEISLNRPVCSFDLSSRITNSALTAVEEMIHWQRLQLLVTYTARNLNYKYLLVGDNASQLAVHCLGGIAQGRGGTVATELGFVDTRYGEVTILRPMYSFLANEVAMYLHLVGLDAVIESPPSTRQSLLHGSAANSIQRLTQDFISSLQFVRFPSTVMAVLSAASKTVPTEARLHHNCAVCYAPLRHSNEVEECNTNATALAAYNFSSRISKGLEASFHSSAASPSPHPPTKDLCVSCYFNQAELRSAGLCD